MASGKAEGGKAMKEYANEREMFADILIEARIKKSQLLIDAYPEKITFPEKHLKRMEKLIARAESTPSAILIGRNKKRLIALLIAAAMVIFGGLTVYAHGDQIVRFVKEVFSSFNTVSYESDSDVPEVIETEYTMEYVPEGYEPSNTLINDVVVKLQWVNSAGSELTFRQALINQSSLNNDNDHSSDEHIQIGDLTVYHVFSTDGYNSYTWDNGEYIFQISCSTPLSLEEVTKMVESVNPKM